MKDRELTPEEDQYVIRGGNAYATCCSQTGMVGANGVDDRFELVAAHRAGFKSAMSYRDAQDRMDRVAASDMLVKRQAAKQLETLPKHRLIEIVMRMAPLAIAAAGRPEWDVREGRFVNTADPMAELFR